MEQVNILDSEEQERSFLYGNRSLYCLLGGMLLLGTTALVLNYIEENNFSRTLEMGLIMTPFLAMGIVSLIGCYFGVQSIRFKEPKRWRSILGLLSNISLVLMVCFTLTLTFLPQKVESDMPLILEEQEIVEE